MSALSMRPKAQTCFRVLVNPKNYPPTLVCMITWISTYPIHNYGMSLIDKTYIQCFNIFALKNWRGILSKQAVFTECVLVLYNIIKESTQSTTRHA